MGGAGFPTGGRRTPPSTPAHIGEAEARKISLSTVALAPTPSASIVYCSPYFAVARNAPPISYVPVSLSLFGNSPNLKPRVGEALCRFCSSLVIAGFHGRAGYLASWRPLYEGHRAIRITGLPFKTFDEAEAACDAMLKH
jgi:hypothetical protein